MKHAKTLLDFHFDEVQKSINKDFLKDWEPFEKLNKKVERALVRALTTGRYHFQPTHDIATKKAFTPTVKQDFVTDLGQEAFNHISQFKPDTCPQVFQSVKCGLMDLDRHCYSGFGWNMIQATAKLKVISKLTAEEFIQSYQYLYK